MILTMCLSLQFHLNFHCTPLPQKGQKNHLSAIIVLFTHLIGSLKFVFLKLVVTIFSLDKYPFSMSAVTRGFFGQIPRLSPLSRILYIK
jgi:hypothetical protein